MRLSDARMVVLAGALAGVAATVSLGLWQLDRARQKTTLQAALDSRAALPPLPGDALARDAAAAEAQHFRASTVSGTWIARATVFLDNRPLDGRSGFIVVTPLRLHGRSDAVLVQRGWVPRDARDRSLLPVVPTPDGTVTLTARVAPPPSKLFEFAASEPGPIRQNLELDAFARETGLVLLPLSLQQLDGADDALARRWPMPAIDVHKHYGYAFQWFALAVLIAGLYVWFQLVRPRRRA